jgi:hypothetical protein
MRYIYSLLVLGTFYTSISWAIAEEVNIYVAPGKYSDYYHLKFTLTADNVYQKPPSERYLPDNRKLGSNFTVGGQFEVYIPKKQFPIQAPNCKDYILLRMPWTNPDFPNSISFVKEKKILFEKIEAIKRGEIAAVDVVIELNPYVKVKNMKPLRLELEECNVFFRHASGRYIDYVGPLKK